jgi:hypothetical protein
MAARVACDRKLLFDKHTPALPGRANVCQLFAIAPAVDALYHAASRKPANPDKRRIK